MTPFASHAQNFEDVILWRALKDVENGVYVDVGAQDPVIDSVSLGFYERGWRGVHVEASPHFAEKLRRARPDETVIEAAGPDPGPIAFFEVPGTGLGTGDPDIARRHEAEGREVRRLEVPCMTFDAIMAPLAGGDVHWMKIDVEGMEATVLESWQSDLRPWIVLVEATEVNSQTTSHEAWEPDLLARGYRFVYFDGLNRFYVSEAHPELAASFGPGPNVFDAFVLSDTSQFNAPQAETIAELRANVQKMIADLAAHRNQIEMLRRDLASSEARERDSTLLVESYRSSTSWRITAPLRTAMHYAAKGRSGARAWMRLAPGSRPHRLALGATSRAETFLRANPRLASAARKTLARLPRLRTAVNRTRAAAKFGILPSGSSDFVAAEHPLRDRLVALLELEIAREHRPADADRSRPPRGTDAWFAKAGHWALRDGARPGHGTGSKLRYRI